MVMDFRDNMEKCQEYVQALEEERRKIQVFQRELPLCLDLVTQAIETCKQQLVGRTTASTECYNGHSECSEQTTSAGPVFEEFIPLKRSNSSCDDEDDHELELESNKPQSNDNNNSNSSDKSVKKSDWLRSVQLWNQTPDPSTPQEEVQPKRVAVVEVKKNGGGAFHPFQKEKTNNNNGNSNNNVNVNVNVKKASPANPAASACSSADTATGGLSSGGGGGSGGKKEGPSSRKARRCWSPELHKRFLHALQQLGGSHVATPKQIRELMKVDGLTNDEVKSHLQKYRLHTRRPSPAVHNNANSQAPQFVVVGGIWMPPPEYAAVTAAVTSGDTNPVSAPNGIYAPVAAVAAPSPQPQSSTVVAQRRQQNQSSQSHCEERGSHSDGGVRSNSPATSSSTHTTTASHAY